MATTVKYYYGTTLLGEGTVPPDYPLEATIPAGNHTLKRELWIDGELKGTNEVEITVEDGLEEGLVRRYSFESIADNTVVDSAGGQDGTIFGTGAALETGVSGNALRLGPSSRISTPNFSSPEYTVSVWLKLPTSTGELQTLIDGGYNSDGHLYIITGRDLVQFYVHDDLIAINSGAYPAEDTYYNFVFTCKPNDTMKIYRNAVQIGTKSIGAVTPNPSKLLGIGSRNEGSSNFTNVPMDELKIFDYAADQVKINELYNEFA